MLPRLGSGVGDYFKGLKQRLSSSVPAQIGIYTGITSGILYTTLRTYFTNIYKNPNFGNSNYTPPLELNPPMYGGVNYPSTTKELFMALVDGAYYGGNMGNRIGTWIQALQNKEPGGSGPLGELPVPMNNQALLMKGLPILCAIYNNILIFACKEYQGKPFFNNIENLSYGEWFFIYGTSYGLYVGGTFAIRFGCYLDFITNNTLIIDFGITRIPRLIDIIKDCCKKPSSRRENIQGDRDLSVLSSDYDDEESAPLLQPESSEHMGFSIGSEVIDYFKGLKQRWDDSIPASRGIYIGISTGILYSTFRMYYTDLCGNTTFGNTTLGNTTIGNATFVNTTFGNTSLGNTIIGNATFVNTTFGNACYANGSLTNINGTLSLELNLPMVGGVYFSSPIMELFMDALNGAYYGGNIGNRIGTFYQALRDKEPGGIRALPTPMNNLSFLMKILPILCAAYCSILIFAYKDYGGKPFFSNIENLNPFEWLVIFGTAYGLYVGGTFAIRTGTYLDYFTNNTLIADLGITRIPRLVEKIKECCKKRPSAHGDTVSIAPDSGNETAPLIPRTVIIHAQHEEPVNRRSCCI